MYSKVGIIGVNKHPYVLGIQSLIRSIKTNKKWRCGVFYINNCTSNIK
jgi:hypothetical protein